VHRSPFVWPVAEEQMSCSLVDGLVDGSLYIQVVHGKSPF